MKLIDQCDNIWPDAAKPENQNIFFSFGLTVFTIYNATKSTWLGKRIGGQKIDPFDNLKGMLLHILISYEKKNMRGTNGEVFKNFKVQMENDSHSPSPPPRKKQKQNPYKYIKVRL